MEGIFRTRVGYTGGEKDSPIYRDLGNHTEALQVDFDPNQITFESIVELFWQSHNPIGAAYSCQYKSAIWYSDDFQQEAIEKTRLPLLERFQRELTTDILPLRTFYNAEDYHQKYCLQRSQAAMKFFDSVYPEFQGFIDSTAAARLNGFSAGHGSKALLEAEQISYGLPVDDIAQLARI